MESDPKWHAVVQASLHEAHPQSKVYLCPEKQAYLEAFRSSEIMSPDLILIDGIWREECLEVALPYIEHGTSIIFHDSENESFQETLSNLPEGVKRRDFYGPCWGIENFRGWSLMERA